MNNKHKKIAEIIKKSTVTITNEYGSEKYVKVNVLKSRLADLFEEEAFEKGCDIHTGKHLKPFNRTQFLKTCRVKE